MTNLPGAIPVTVLIPIVSPTVNLSVVFINGGARDIATVTRVYPGNAPYNMVDLRVSGEPHDRKQVSHEQLVKGNGSLNVPDLVWAFS